MRRGITKEKTIELVENIREKVPDIALRTTLIAGYPGETEEDFAEMKDWVQRTRFNRLGIFTYSHEENTRAYSLKDDVAEEVKKQRMEEIMALQEDISFDHNRSLVGKKMKILVDRKEGNYFVGRTEFDSPEVDNEVLVAAERTFLRTGDFAEVKITSAEAFDLYAEAVNC
jgi:ribosomal protein S12 methylthiotransferase